MYPCENIDSTRIYGDALDFTVRLTIALLHKKHRHWDETSVTVTEIRLTPSIVTLSQIVPLIAARTRFIAPSCHKNSCYRTSPPGGFPLSVARFPINRGVIYKLHKDRE